MASLYDISFEKAKERYDALEDKRAKILFHKGKVKLQDGDDETLIQKCIDKAREDQAEAEEANGGGDSAD